MEAGDGETRPRHLVGDCEVCGEVVPVVADGRCDVDLPRVLQEAGLPPEQNDSVLHWVALAVVVERNSGAVD